MAFTPATRKALPVHISLAGRTGSGKTLSALKLARGLVGPKGRIAGICTERGRMSLYAGQADLIGEDGVAFYADELHPPFTAARYSEKINEAAAAGFDCIVIDSGSHEWSGLGGATDWAADLDPNGTKGPAAWKLPKRAHKRFVNAMLQVPCHVIITLRAATKLIATKDGNGKQQFAESADVMPECEKSFIYEMTLSATIDDKTNVAHFTKLHKDLRGKLADKVIDVSTGTVIREWVMSGVGVDVALHSEKVRLRAAAEEGDFALRSAWATTSRPHQLALKPMLNDELKSIAAAADEAAAIGKAAEEAGDGYDEGPVKRVEHFPDDDGPAPKANGAAPASRFDDL